MLSRMFRVYGQVCASRPLEVIFGTITFTVCMMSMSIFATSYKICGYNYKCTEPDTTHDVKNSDIIVLTITRCIAVVYIYMQFRNLRKLGSKYLLGIAGLFTVFASLVFSIAVINLLGDDLSGLHEALPFFLLLVDLSRASTLARFALSSTSQGEVADNIARGMAVIGPGMTLDAIVEILVIGVGTLSGVKQLETMCCFGCLSVVANYVAFMTFFPACLALILELTQGSGEGQPVWQLRNVAAKVFCEDEEQKPNPVTQNIKLIMSAGLVIVHTHSRYIAVFASQDVTALDGDPELTHLITPNIPLWQFVLQKSCPPTLDYVITSVLVLVLGMKYVLYDQDEDVPPSSNMNQMPATLGADVGDTKVITHADYLAITDNMVEPQVELALPTLSEKPLFTIGGDSSDSESDAEKRTTSTATQTDWNDTNDCIENPAWPSEPRPLEKCLLILNSDTGPEALSDEEILNLVRGKHLPAYKLEGTLSNYERGVSVRRQLISQSLPMPDALANLPYTNYDYKYVDGACCENVLGYMPLPVGVAGPLLINNKQYHVPMATTEGCLVASTNRGCRAISAGGGASAVVVGSGMTRAPVVRFPNVREAAAAKIWLTNPDNVDLVTEAFNGTSRFARLQRMHTVQAARMLYIRFVAQTGDAMGMNMLSKGSEKALLEIQQHFPNMEILALSGNFCTDKKPAAINWVEGRGKSVVCEAIISANTIKTVLKTTVPALIDLNINKNFIGSAMAGSIGGFNAHAANVVTALFIATGQDPAQAVSSCNCITVMEASGSNGEDLYISCTMPSVEVGTVGGGTVLPPQAACLKMLGVQGSHHHPGSNAEELAMVVCSAVMAGELSLISALAAGHLVKSHLKHNRSAINVQDGKTLACKGEELGSCIQKAL